MHAIDGDATEEMLPESLEVRPVRERARGDRDQLTAHSEGADAERHERGIEVRTIHSVSDQSPAVRRAGAELRIGGIHDDDVERALDASVGREADARLDEVANDDLGRDSPTRPGGAGFAVGHCCLELRGNAGIDFNGP